MSTEDAGTRKDPVTGEMVSNTKVLDRSSAPGYILCTDKTNKLSRELCVKHNVDCSGPPTNAHLLDKLVGEFIESLCQ
ncbi:hypothetical protein BKA70DRAFT_1429240 [Coprinopsis sp. MPI-PUGE-AT-0042]|nr:hypothetical protein BKA70DRAFT_1429240 [Coprinopsis sp. MPI-PUGE-AT-0042]